MRRAVNCAAIIRVTMVKLTALLNGAEKMSDEEFRERMAEGLKGLKSAAEIVAEGRGRL